MVLVVWVTLLHHGISVEKDDAHEGEDLGQHVVPAQRIVQREGRKRGENERGSRYISAWLYIFLCPSLSLLSLSLLCTLGNLLLTLPATSLRSF